MSRTKKGGKAPGYEYWSRRPFNRCGQYPGPASKKRTHKTERANNKREARDGQD